MNPAAPAPRGQASLDLARQVFDSAAAAPPDQQHQKARELCGGDADLLSLVLKLLDAHRRAAHTDIIAWHVIDAAEPAVRNRLGAQPLPEMPARIGHYHLRATLGEGGFGIVYLAEQTEPLRRIVALKLIKPGMDSRAIIARFEQERQALAMMDHPGIARVIDAGADERGRPFFVMEHVGSAGVHPAAGKPITIWCDQERLGIPQRLTLFMRACDAVQHAHTKAVIHRDLKPSNILIAEPPGGEPVPKVIDFGIAKALDPAAARPPSLSAITGIGQLIGTPEYMSPEQAGGSDVDTRADVYALGVILYELLTGTLPVTRELHALPTASRDGGASAPLNPPLPSTRLSTLGDRLAPIAASRASDPRALARSLRGDLDWIVMRALERDRSRRYQSPADLAADLQRYLEGRPVLAGPPSRIYRLRKYARRHKSAVAAGLALAITLLAGSAGTTAGFISASRRAASESAALNEVIASAQLAEKHQRETQLVADFQARMLSSIDPAEAGDQLIADILERLSTSPGEQNDASPPDERLARTAAHLRTINPTDIAAAMISRTILRPAAESLKSDFAEQPLVAAALHKTLGEIYERLGLIEDAAANYEHAYENRRKMLGDESDLTIQSLMDLGGARLSQQRFDEGEVMLRQALETSRRIFGDSQLTVAAIHGVGTALQMRGRWQEVEPFFRESLELSVRLLGQDHLDTITARHNLGILLNSLGKQGEAEPLVHQAIEGFRRRLGPDHPDTISALVSYANLLTSYARYAEAEPIRRDVYEALRRLHGDDHPGTLHALNAWGITYWYMGRSPEGEPLIRRAMETAHRVLGDDNPDTLLYICNMGTICAALGRFGEAEEHQIRSLEGRRRALGDDHPMTLISLNNVGFALQSQGKYKETEPYFREALERRTRVLGVDHPDTITSINNMGYILLMQGDLEAARPYYDRALEGRRRINGEDHPETVMYINNTGMLLMERGLLDDAEPYLQEAADRARRIMGVNHPESVLYIANYAHLQHTRGRFTDAETIFREALAAAQHIAESGGGHRQANIVAGMLGLTLLELRRGDEAEPLLLQLYGEPPNLLPAREVARRQRTFARTIELYESLESHDRAAAWRDRLEALTD
jgi:eukaryotic-like serine/threonine-protein kinase